MKTINVTLIFNDGARIDTDWEDIERGVWDMSKVLRAEETTFLTIEEIGASLVHRELLRRARSARKRER